ncbi:MAG: Ig-like domain-containing protein, partial [Sulfuricurvum sp.]|uniref:Ig-like domain-containing protein n=1 Tax=Sulfuricurvum sp. TaxID=2025608 RepID=UPI00273637CF
MKQLNQLFLLLTIVFTLSLSAIQVDTDYFNSNSDGWSGGTYDSSNDRYVIARDATASKGYNLNSAYALKNVIISFDVSTYGGWEVTDSLKVTANGVTTTFTQTDGTYSYSVNAVVYLDSVLDLSINPDTSHNDEKIWIDNIVITFIAADGINDTYSMVKNTTSTGNVLSNDIGPALSVTSHTNPSHGTVSIAANGSFTYTPALNYMGTDTFNYTIEDENGYNDTATVTFTITDTITSGYRDFSLRKQLYTKGDMKTIGNTVLVPPTDQSAGICSTYINGPFTTDASSANDSYYLCGYHNDTTTGGLANSTTSSLQLPAGAKVLWAGLYWQAIVANGSFNTNMTVKLRQEEGSNTYTDITPDRLDYLQDGGYSGYTSYSAFADVSEYFGEGKWNEGNYTVANIPVYEGKITSLGSYGAWALVIAYTNTDDPNEKFRSFSIFDGWKIIDSSNPNVDVDVTGFYTPDQTTIEAKSSVFAAEGDKHISGDVLNTTNYNTSTPVTLATVTNNTFNSSISGGNSRTPLLTNNNGIDIQTFDIGDYLTPKQASMRFTFTSTQDRYWPSMIAFSTELYVPQFCYDYGYEQNGLPFTEENTGTAMPYITGYLPNTADINVSLYIRNQEASDVQANNIKLSIDDINASEATYIRNSVAVT